MKCSLVFLLIGCVVHHIDAGVYTDRFLQQYNKMNNRSNGYFSAEGIPYHSVETLIVEAPDHGHQSTSEGYSYYIWLEAMYGKITKDFTNYINAWRIMEEYTIPGALNQPTNNMYHPWAPATYSDEKDWPSEYPSWMQFNVPVGHDPIYQELVDAYGNSDVYAMHWLVDVDNVYGFGNSPGNCEAGPDTPGPSYINTYQRGPQESVWRTIPQTTCDTFKYGGQYGFLDLFVGDNNHEQQWKYSVAPDADARAISGAFWASQWAAEEGVTSPRLTTTLAKAGKLGDYLRYALFDKYFKKVGNCVGTYGCAGGDGKNSAHYLIAWYFAWGGSLGSNGWAWRIGDGAAHFGYQNPLAAYALVNEPSMRPKGASAVSDWQMSLDRQLEFYQFLQTEEGAFAGGATNTWNGRYDTPPENLTQNTFHGMFYDWEPVYHDPPSNNWYGMQPWSADRLAQYYYVTGDETAKTLLDKWVAWAVSEISFDHPNGYQLPDQLSWEGVPPNVHVSVTKYGSDVGPASATARTLSYYAAKTGNITVKNVAKQLLDGIWQHQTDKGVSLPETMETYSRFNEPVYVPDGWRGVYPNGDVIDPSATFIKLRSWYKNDPDWPKVEAYLNGGPAPVFTYHRFWQQADVALAQGTYGILFNE